MKKQTIYYACLITFVVLYLTACKKDGPSPNNPLNGTAVFNPDKTYGKMTDVDGNQYKTIKIGNQTWMAENLRTTHYRNGAEIPNITGNDEWASLTTGAYCNYNNTNNMDTIATYGRLYNWYAVDDTRKLAPNGWRVPAVADWLELIEYLGGDTIASKALKEAGDYHWRAPVESDNSSGFTAIPNGRRYLAENYSGIGSYSVLWTASGYNEASAGFLYLYRNNTIVYKGVNYKVNGYAVRLIKETN